MRKYALLKNNTVVSVQDVTDEEYPTLAQENQQLVDVEDMSPLPQIGWVLSGNKLTPPAEAHTVEMLVQRIRAARLFGTSLVGEMVDKIGAKNILMGKTEAEIILVVASLAGIRALLEGGALVTARSAIQAIRPKYPYLVDEMNYAVDKLNQFLSGA